jgi:competence protein ComEC
MAINAFRWNLAQRILARMGPSSGGLGVAMITGHEAWITQD